ncbi:MAG TPA: MBL fold metallo-hydrolase [Actinomycetota bacterium]|nr:MBL fold metallo-hydrolase [Actinomycetota bacterium]
MRITRVLAPNPGIYTLEGTNTWVVGLEPSIVIDPGPELAEHLDEVARVASPVAAIVVTHAHEDHAPAAMPLAERVGAPVLAFRLPGADRLRPGQAIRGGGVELTAVHTPGHSSDHVAFLEPTTRSLFTGDAVVGRGTSFIDPPDGDLVRYLRSLRRMLDLDPRTIYPGHGPVVLRARAKLGEYLAHRDDREQEIRSVLVEGSRTVPQIVAEVYAEHPPEVHPLAARSVLAHLLKLEREGTVVRTGGGEDGPWSASGPRACERCGRRVRGRGRYCGSCSLALLQGDG